MEHKNCRESGDDSGVFTVIILAFLRRFHVKHLQNTHEFSTFTDSF